MPRGPRPSEAQMDAWRALLLTSRGLRAALEQELQREVHVSLTTYEVLRQLWEAPERRLRMQELARGTALSRNGLSQLVGRMETAGLVGRCGVVDDGRGTVCTLTGEGSRVFERAAVVHARGVQTHFASRFTDPEAARLAALLRHLSAEWRPTERGCTGADHGTAPPELTGS